MKQVSVLLLTCGLSYAFAQKTFPLSFTSPATKPALVGEGFISTFMNERDFALSPDGNEIFYTISTPKSTFQTIVYSRQIKKGEWSQPEVAPFAGHFSDLEPCFTADGNTLYFASNRPLSGQEVKDFDIWKVSRTGGVWGKAENLGNAVNTPADEFYPSVTRNGTVYFTAAYKGGPGREDIYMSAWKDNQYQKAVALDTAVNSKFYEFNAFVDPNEQFILFTSYGRKDDAGGGDLYLAVKGADSRWKPAQNLSEINSKQLDYCPFVSTDGKILFFTSERHQLPASFPEERATTKRVKEILENPLNGTGNIYWMNFMPLLAGLKK